MNTDAITLGRGFTDQGAWDRAIMVARELYACGLWDGEAPLIIHDAYAVHNRVFGLDYEPLRSLTPGIDYEVHP